MEYRGRHDQAAAELRSAMHELLELRKSQEHLPPITLNYHSNSSYTTRSKQYKNSTAQLSCAGLDEVLFVDLSCRRVFVEPRVTMSQLLAATLPFGLIPAVLPEIKEITVGGAIMGMAGESGSHRYGCFSDQCRSLEFLLGNGEIIRVTPSSHPELFYGSCGSYGSLGTLLLAELQLVEAKSYIALHYTFFNDPKMALEAISALLPSSESPTFIEGIIFSPNLAVVIQGSLLWESELDLSWPHYSVNAPFAPFYFEHLLEIAADSTSGRYAEVLTHRDYFFRYDCAAFWMGSYLMHLPLLSDMLCHCIRPAMNREISQLKELELQRYTTLRRSKKILRPLLRQLLSSKMLCKALHRAERWVQNRFIIQDLCIPEPNASSFLQKIIVEPALFPIWLLPIKGTNAPQLFAPHLLSDKDHWNHFINFGLYGMPSCAMPTTKITRQLEELTRSFNGRKVLYSHSHYSEREFWDIYSRSEYEGLRESYFANNVWHDITDKVLSM